MERFLSFLAVAQTAKTLRTQGFRKELSERRQFSEVPRCNGERGDGTADRGETPCPLLHRGSLFKVPSAILAMCGYSVIVDIPRWLEDLMDLLDLDPVERAEWIRHWNEHDAWRRLGHWGLKLLKERGHLTPSQLEEAVRVQRDSKEPDLGKILIALGLVGEREVLQAKAMEMGIGFVDIERVKIENTAIKLANRKLVTTHGAIPVKKDGSTLWLAMSEPNNTEAAEVFRIESECRVIPVLATPSEIQRAIDRYYPVGG